MRTNITRAAIAGAAATAMLIGAAGAATAQPALPAGAADIISRAAEAVPGAEALIPGQRTQLGEVSQWGVYSATLYKQVMGSQIVTQGEKITLRVEVEGGKNVAGTAAQVEAITDVMPAGFQIDSVVLNRPDGTTTALAADQYNSVEREGLRDTRVDLKNNGIGRIHIGGGSLSMDFTYIAPETTGWHQTGAGMETSAGSGSFPHATKVDTGGPSVNVVPRPVLPPIPGLPGGDGNSSGSVDWGSLNTGSSK